MMQRITRRHNTKPTFSMSASRIAIRRIAALSGPRAQASLLGARPFTSLGETLTSKVSLLFFSLAAPAGYRLHCTHMSHSFLLNSQERAEEARYIRLREKAAMEARKEAAKGDKDLEDAMHDAAGIIAATHDKLSHEALLNIAKWKLGRIS